MEITVGLQNEAKTVVCEKNTASAIGSGALPVYGTPFMIALMEEAASTSLQPYLAPGQGSVGTHLDVSHEAATHTGMEVRAVSTVTEVDGRRIVFKVEAFDADGRVGSGTHERFIIDNERFMKKVEAKMK